ncbi:valyl-tRNA synthetase [Salinibacter ruber]|uniref:Valine--tRNA ligase n=1 Tax=Salinibacter ruber TaxID=146919 RepID=A0A9X2THN4_9BACT|nr:valine--tRNA ligase [Salinibacter ruber]MBB4061361.1 valyl-tRNA synthetase [Salinibacter ruber]MBB4069485.1 valyl-tRNA synthetase [Salinibacter ruber]MCS3658675.1 valyl-tRNA synthetase [Salinibacter ruber]MCS3671032.1 valyl-tRNA synthetase [Salinibacter ruber]MCS3708154.1 valyl-tRNA synthetase [Salinibacter ruber]
MPDDAPSLASMSKAYDPSDIEDKWYAYWEEHGFFEADADGDADSHVIMMPPPNVTGRLHIGHALQDSIQDALTRIHRMKGDETLWMPGLDHAGIATQNAVEDDLREAEGKTRHDLGREAFVERVRAWKEEYGDLILDQKRTLGDSCDWGRQRFTMDEGFTRAVQEVFVQLHEEGLIYRGDYLVNWDPENETALSDEEVENEEREGHLWHVQYPLAGAEDESLTIATTRPETMLGDTAIAVDPDDERYEHLVGETAILPLLGREIPIIADERIDSDFGTGALKVTPAHDETDFEIGEDHGLEKITIMSPTGDINENGGPYEGMDRFDARDQIVEDLEEEGLLVAVEDYMMSVPLSERSEAVIEPLISRQWFVEMEPLAEPAIEAVRDGEIEFFPDRWANEYFRWMENIRDWCISRQLWWGHRIPVWYYTDENGEADPEQGYVVSIDQPEDGMVQETDVLDTWFSSWLWPFATLGWPEETDDLEKFYPTDVLVSGYDILFFWIARMIMAGYEFTGRPPFKNVFITGMVKDAQGRWMSKSLGNGIDPLEMVDQYGADATRFTLTLLCAQGQDIKLAPSKFEMGRNFANKIWNAFNVFGQFMDRDDAGVPVRDYQRERSFEELELVEQWMLHRLHTAIQDVEDSLDRYRLNEIAERVYDVFWRDYCDWYLELIKPPYGEEMEADKIALAAEIYETLLTLLHPLMPFITEELWWKVRPRGAGEACIAADWPSADDEQMDAAAAETFELIQEMISGVRGIKSDYGVGLGQEIEATVSVPVGDEALADTVRRYADYFDKLASVTDLTVEAGAEKPTASASVVVGRCEVFVPLAGMIDLEQERERLRGEIEEKETFLEGVEQKLNNPQFVNKAPDEVVERERQKKKDTTAELERLQDNLADLEAV